LTLFQVNFHNLTIQGVQHLSKLKSLRKLIFYFEQKKEAKRVLKGRLYSCIIQHLPWLQQVGPTMDKSNLYDCDYLCECTFEELYDIDTSDLCGSFDLTDFYSSSSLPHKARMPHLENLHFQGPMTTHRSLDALSTYASLTYFLLTKTPMSDVGKILQVVGSRLKNLFLEAMPDKLDLIEVFHRCPNLSQFGMHICVFGVHEHHTQFWPKVNSHNFRLLKIFNVVLQGAAPAGFLKLIFEAPLMEQIDLINVLLSPQDCCIVHEVLEGTLQNLENVTYKNILNKDTSIVHDLAKMLKCVICSAPDLDDFHVSFFENDLETMWYSKKDIQYFKFLLRM